MIREAAKYSLEMELLYLAAKLEEFKLSKLNNKPQQHRRKNFSQGKSKNKLKQQTQMEKLKIEKSW